mmetsp:Transcript_147017/g.469829  ORF Transcript_147017/g.469829 Transcript_147017/m.469829 type:complete len:223 (-) Transcript_147017:1312-1980(-)
MDANRLRAAIGAAVSVGRTSAGVSETKCFASVAAAGGEASRSLPRSPTARAVAELHAAARLCGSGAGGGGAAEGASGTGGTEVSANLEGRLLFTLAPALALHSAPREASHEQSWTSTSRNSSLANLLWLHGRSRGCGREICSFPQTSVLATRCRRLCERGPPTWTRRASRWSCGRWRLHEARMRTWPGPWGWKRRGGCRRARHKGSRTAFGLARPWPCTTFR